MCRRNVGRRTATAFHNQEQNQHWEDSMSRRINLSALRRSLGLAATGLGAVLTLTTAAHAAAKTALAPSAQSVVHAAAEALGGEAKIKAVRNISLHGYGQRAWLIGAEEITSSRDVPFKYEQLNDLHRVYDLEHDRFQAREREFTLFPFLAAKAYSFPLSDQRLDGDIAYDTAVANIFGGPDPKLPRRVAVNSIGMNGDGVHGRRMWMMNNPVVLVRALLDPGAKLGKPHRVGKNLVINAVLKQGDKVEVGFFTRSEWCQAFCAGLPAYVRWAVPNPDLGQASFSTWFTGYTDQQGLLLPLGFNTKLDWRAIDFMRVYVDKYEIDTAITDLAAPAEVRNGPVPPDNPVRPVTVEKVADHIWRLAPAGTTAIEFKDHITLFELDASAAQAQATIDAARKLVPGKPVTQLIASHEHFDHVTGMRQAIANGLTIISRRASGEQFAEMAKNAAPDFPDDLAKHPKPFKFIPVDEKLTLSDDTMTLDVLWARNNIHMADAVVAYAPKQKVIMEGDIATASLVWQFWPDSLRDIIDYYHLDVAIDSPVHSIDPQHPGSLTMAQLDEIVKGGADRARKLCADQMAKDYYLAGCPIWSKRY
jgi:glyoxylase-like metal-dependent hydrolase (beta-lactamase superfamily II)